jgi:hypothetical protein
MKRPTRDSPAGRAYLDLQNLARRQNRGTQELLTISLPSKGERHHGRRRRFLSAVPHVAMSHHRRRPALEESRNSHPQ